jgi:hypothetical protein
MSLYVQTRLVIPAAIARGRFLDRSAPFRSLVDVNLTVKLTHYHLATSLDRLPLLIGEAGFESCAVDK